MIYLKYNIYGAAIEKQVIYIVPEKCVCHSLSKKIPKVELEKKSTNNSAGDSFTHNVQTKVQTISVTFDSTFLARFVNELKVSKKFRQSVIQDLISKVENNNSKIKLFVTVHQPKKEIVDYRWNERMTHLSLERKELDHTMSWLSTLGGAFSALGDHYTNCAEIAGKISIHQFKLALRIGDPLTVARCKLYLGLSLIQRGDYKTAKRLVLEQYYLCQQLPVVDSRLIRMCQGIWAKLKYDIEIHKQGKMLPKCNNSQINIMK